MIEINVLSSGRTPFLTERAESTPYFLRWNYYLAGDILASSPLGKYRLVFVIVVPVVVGEPGVARNNIEHDFASFKIEAEFQLPETCFAHRFPDTRLVFFAVKHEKSSSSCTRDFSADRPILLSEFIPSIDLGIGDSFREPLLGLPVHVQKLSEAPQIAI